jgi:hypothetical protein
MGISNEQCVKIWWPDTSSSKQTDRSMISHNCILTSLDVRVTMHYDKFLYNNKPTGCTNFLDLFLEWNSTCFGQFLCPSSGVFHCTHGSGICHTGLLTAYEQTGSQAVSKPVWHIPLPCVQWKTSDDGQRNCPKHVEFLSKNKFEKSVHLVGLLQGGSNMTGTDFCVNKPHLSRSYLNHLVL